MTAQPQFGLAADLAALVRLLLSSFCLLHFCLALTKESILFVCPNDGMYENVSVASLLEEAN